MNGISTPRPPQLERFLLDADVSPEVEPLLRAVGFRTQSVNRVKVNVHDDAAIVRWARPRNYIVVCHDRHKDFVTRLSWCPEIGLYGGQVLEVSGDDVRTPHVTVGQILTHIVHWRAWFEAHTHGVVFLHSNGYRGFTQDRLLGMVPNVLPLWRDDVAERIRNRAPTPKKKRSQLRRATDELPLTEHDATLA